MKYFHACIIIITLPLSCLVSAESKHLNLNDIQIAYLVSLQKCTGNSSLKVIDKALNREDYVVIGGDAHFIGSYEKGSSACDYFSEYLEHHVLNLTWYFSHYHDSKSDKNLNIGEGLFFRRALEFEL